MSNMDNKETRSAVNSRQMFDDYFAGPLTEMIILKGNINTLTQVLVPSYHTIYFLPTIEGFLKLTIIL